MDWFNFIRDVCAQYFVDHPVQIGGPGLEVEIDESKFGRRKYHRGRIVEGHWVFGGTERVTGNSFLVEVAKRDAATLLPIITQYIRAGWLYMTACILNYAQLSSYLFNRTGNVIYSDEWRAYCRIPAITGKNYTHRTVNHSQNFVDPVTGMLTI